MAGLSHVVDSRYCSPNSINLKINMENDVTYNNDNNQVIFRMEKHFSHRRRRVLQDASSKPICVLHKKKGTTHGRWEAFVGDTSELSFIVRRPSTIASSENIVLDVFLANNTEESVCKVNASAKTKTCEIYAGQSTLASANMESKAAMTVKVEANIDHAFIVALLMIVDYKMINKLKKIGKGLLKVTSEGLTIAATAVGIAEFVEANEDDGKDDNTQK